MHCRFISWPFYLLAIYILISITRLIYFPVTLTPDFVSLVFFPKYIATMGHACQPSFHLLFTSMLPLLTFSRSFANAMISPAIISFSPYITRHFFGRESYNHSLSCTAANTFLYGELHRHE